MINSGGRPRYGGLELEIEPTNDLCDFLVENLDLSNKQSVKWFASLKGGFEDFRARRISEGRPIGGVRLKVTKIHSHIIDTNESYMRRLAAEAIDFLFGQHEVPIGNDQ
jgi:hypothetical protein